MNEQKTSQLPGFPSSAEFELQNETRQAETITEKDLSLITEPNKTSLMDSKAQVESLLLSTTESTIQNEAGEDDPDETKAESMIDSESEDESSSQTLPTLQSPRHVQRNISRNFHCDICDKYFATKGTLSKHLKSHLEYDSTFTCSVCAKVFKHKSTLDKHIKIHIKGQSFDCLTCGKRYSEKRHLIQHNLVHEDVRPFICDECGAAFRRKYHLKAHMKRHVGKKAHVCDLCGKAFYEKFRLTEHELTHQTGGSHTCELCGSVFQLKDYLRRHMKRIHKETKTHKCETCGKVFKDKSSRDRHWNNEHALDKDKNFVCGVCSKNFLVNKDLMRHMRCHTKVYKCDVCDKTFKCNKSLTRHHFSHAGVKPYACQVCEKKFTGGENLRLHQAKHSRDLLYWCDVCNRMFATEAKLVNHLTSHSDISFHKCKDCGRLYSKDENLQAHKKIHSFHPAASCMFCGKCFDDKTELELHALRHYRSEVFSCAVCFEAFKEENELDLHIENHKVIAPKWKARARKKHKCSVCGGSFTGFNSATHLGLHPGRVVSCQHCNKTFSSVDSPGGAAGCPGVLPKDSQDSSLDANKYSADGSRVEEDSEDEEQMDEDEGDDDDDDDEMRSDPNDLREIGLRLRPSDIGINEASDRNGSPMTDDEDSVQILPAQTVLEGPSHIFANQNGSVYVYVDDNSKIFKDGKEITMPPTLSSENVESNNRLYIEGTHLITAGNIVDGEDNVDKDDVDDEEDGDVADTDDESSSDSSAKSETMTNEIEGNEYPDSNQWNKLHEAFAEGCAGGSNENSYTSDCSDPVNSKNTSVGKMNVETNLKFKESEAAFEDEQPNIKIEFP